MTAVDINPTIDGREVSSWYKYPRSPEALRRRIENNNPTRLLADELKMLRDSFPDLTFPDRVHRPRAVDILRTAGFETEAKALEEKAQSGAAGRGGSVAKDKIGKRTSVFSNSWKAKAETLVSQTPAYSAIFKAYRDLKQSRGTGMGRFSSGIWIEAGGTQQQVKDIKKVAKAQARSVSEESDKRERKARKERKWNSDFIPRVFGTGKTGTRASKSDRLPPDPMLYTAHLFTGYLKELGRKLVVVFKTGKSDQFHKERRSCARTFGLPVTDYAIHSLPKSRQGKAEVDKRNFLGEALKTQYGERALNFGENDAIVIDNIEDEDTVIDSYLALALEATERATEVVAYA